MILFWTLAGLIAAVGLALLVAPWWRSRGRALPIAIVAAATGLLLAGALYLKLTNWNWHGVDPAVQKAIDELADLRRDTDRHPGDLQAWLHLGATYLRMEQFSSAQHSFERANRIAGGRDVDALAGLAESELLGGVAQGGTGGAATRRARQLFEQALALDPNYGKALFYTAVIASQEGDLPLARERFARMRASGVPPEIAAALDRQIASIDEQLKPAPVDAATAIHVSVRIAGALAGAVPSGAMLFVFARDVEGAPPLAARRLPARLPAEVTLSASDSMIAGRKLRAGQSVDVVARLSSGGTPTAQSGDLYGQIHVRAGERKAQALVIDRRTP